MHTIPVNRPSRHRLTLAAAIALAVAVLSTMLTIVAAAPANAQEAPPATVGPCEGVETVTEYEYQQMTDPGSDPVFATVYHYRRIVGVASWIPFAWEYEYTSTSPSPMSLGAQILGGWSFTGTTQQEIAPGTDPTYETMWAEEGPGDPWEATGNSREDTRPIEVACDEPDPIVSVSVSEQEDCLAGVLIITTTTTTSTYVLEGLVWVLGDPVSVPVVTTEALGGPLCGSGPTTTQATTTSSTLPDETTGSTIGGEVAGIGDEPDDGGVASGGDEVAPTAPASLPRTGASAGALVLVAALTMGLGVTFRTASRRLS